MVETESALPGTAYLSPARRTAFYDHYQKQYAQTLAWLQRALAQAAHSRDQERCPTVASHEAKRQWLAQISGVDQCFSAPHRVAQTPVAGGATTYQVQSERGLLYTGLLWEPPPPLALAGAVILAGEDETTTIQLIAHYQAQGLRVILPCFARSQHSFRDHPQRQWYHFTDDELLHLFFFLCGGSLAGLEAAELLTITDALAIQDGMRLPVVLHLAGRHLLTAVIAAALAPALAQAQSYALLLLPETVDQLDHQETDERVNTIWGFHTDFDALTLFDLATNTNLLFIEATPTPSACFSRALAWFALQHDHPSRQVERLFKLDNTTLRVPVVQRLVPDAAAMHLFTPAPVPANLDMPLLNDLYQQALVSKVAYLESLHDAATHQRRQRYDVTTLTPSAYRTRVAESLERVAGPPLPATTDRKAQTRLIDRHPAYDLYEVILESVPGVEVAGYLLTPTNGQPAPAVICQHGLGGRPEALVGINDRLEGHQWVYDRFAQRLAERGYVVFVPFMNWGWPTTAMRDRLVKHAYALGFAPNRFEVAQLHAIVDFLQARPAVIADRIAFYGLSYGGHASLWLCAHEPRLAAVVTAGHFNEWQTKLLNPELSPPLVRPTAYVTVDEGYDMFNYNVLNELGHAELATRFAPRPQMIENGLQDSVTPTAWVNREFARTQAVFTWLGATDQVELEHFPGPHRVWAEGSFRFLDQHLRPPTGVQP